MPGRGYRPFWRNDRRSTGAAKPTQIKGEKNGSDKIGSDTGLEHRDKFSGVS
jgi:hypothetical protein